ncbi:hypothetical protein OKJ48_38110 [Streptomyces kunmingensis]|uniref:Integral membrane protein n=1 Tax=Streptomyces kunmingensis TaxID=68225 RepID=A0ABU6CMX0_9ACTN|nr:hypothetical protein [Streptomyces kunmingensis]MEB3965997.1 hypothetical protein [Streptomyces kunmingensis]
MSAPRQRKARSAADLRLLRAAVFAAVCVVLSAAGHVLGSTATVPLWTLSLGFLAVFCVAVPLAGRERSLPGIAVTLGIGQIGLHSLFGLGQQASMATGAAEPSVVERAAHLMCGAGASALSPVQAQRILDHARVPADAAGGMHHDVAVVAGSSMPLLPSLPMLIGHLLAAVGAGWLLRRGDLAVGRIVRLSKLSAQGVAEATLVRSLRAALGLVRALRAGLPGAPEALLCAPRAGLRALPALRTAELQHSVIRRGPPAAADTFLLAA